MSSYILLSTEHVEFGGGGLEVMVRRRLKMMYGQWSDVNLDLDEIHLSTYSKWRYQTILITVNIDYSNVP